LWIEYGNVWEEIVDKLHANVLCNMWQRTMQACFVGREVLLVRVASVMQRWQNISKLRKRDRVFLVW
jgi:hypothetical protein